MEEPMTEEDLKNIFVNPYYAITIAPALTGEHEPMVSEQQWISANLKVMEEIGQEAWLKRLLEVLKGNFVAAPSDDQEQDNL